MSTARKAPSKSVTLFKNGTIKKGNDGIKITNNPKVIINIKICAKQGSNLRILR